MIKAVVDQPAIAGTKQDRVMRHLRITFAGTEIPDKEAVGVTGAIKAPIGPAAPDPTGTRWR